MTLTMENPVSAKVFRAVEQLKTSHQIVLHRKYPMTDFRETPVKPTTINTRDLLAISSLHSPAALP